MEHAITLPSKPRIVSEKEFSGVYEIDGLYPGYGHTLGNSLRRVILSSLLGSAITTVKIDGVSHEFSTIEGVQEDVIAILLNIKKIRLTLATDEPQTLTLSIKGPKKITAEDIKLPGQVQILNPEQHIAEVTKSGLTLSITMTAERGLGYVPREVLQEEKADIGTIALDAMFTPTRRVNYEVENMRVGDRTDFNRLRIFIETDGTISPREALERSIEIMIYQLKAIIGFKEEELAVAQEEDEAPKIISEKEKKSDRSVDTEVLKTRIETLSLSPRTENALSETGIRTVGGLARKREEDILAIEGLGMKGLQEIRRALSNFGITLR
jgi:DNA-directed RNA polymerase subunit alpha